MGRNTGKWTESKIQEMQAKGCGKGTSSSYLPWIRVEDISSLGRSRRIWSPKTNRTHHLLSDVELGLFIALEWQRDVTDIREQYPLDRVGTQEIARNLGIRHPYYPGTHIPTVMTVDILATKIIDQKSVLVAFNAKRDEEAEDEKSILKLEIQRVYFEQLGITHHAVYDSQLPKNNIANISDIREAPLKPQEIEPKPGHYANLGTRMALDFPNADRAKSLQSFCIEFDGLYGLAPGTSIRVARILMYERTLIANLSAENLGNEPLSAFVMTGQTGKLRVTGGV